MSSSTIKKGSITLFGLANCDTTIAAKKYLELKGYQVGLHNFKTDGVSGESLDRWCKALGWEKILNKRSTTWRSLTPEEQEKVTDAQSAIAIMLKNSSLVKRPVVEYKGKILSGFDKITWAETFE